MKNRILQLLNIRTDEAWLVTNLFWLQFFQSAGVAIFNAIAFAFFLEKFEVTELPKVYLFSALLLWLSGWIYNKYEHKAEIKNLVIGIISFVAISVLVFRLQFFFTNAKWFVFLMFSWYYVIYLLTNLEFWGVAALLFDIRQSKRLFGMIGAGDIPAKIIGYSAVPFLVKYVGNENALFVSLGSILFSLVFYFKLKKAGKLELHIKHEHEHHDNHHATESVREIVKSFFGNRMIAMVAILSFIVVTCVTIISFSFYSEVKHEMHTDVQLATFIAMFMAGGRVLALIIRLVVTGRIASILGTKGSLLISPIGLFFFLIAIIALSFTDNHHHSVIYIFGVMAILTEVLKTSLQDPVFLSLMQPLSSNLRLKGHTIVKGVMDPFALAFSGIMLYTLIAISHHVDLIFLSYMIFTLLLVWVGMIFIVDREYIRTLVTALNKRYSIGNEIDLMDEKTRNVLRSKIADGERGEAIYILNLVEKNYSEDNEELVLKAMEHRSCEVRMEAIKLAERKKIYTALPIIDDIIENRSGNDHTILPEAVKAKCMLQPDELQTFDTLLEEKDPRLIKSAITGFMISGGISAVVTAGQKLLQLIVSPNADDRKMAAEIIGDLGIQSFYKPLFELMRDQNPDVVKAAINAAGKVKNEKLVGRLLQFFNHRQYEKIATDALTDAGDVALKDIEHAIVHEKLSRRQQSKLILVCGRIGTAQATKVLDDMVWKLPYLRTDIFHAMHMCEFKTLPSNKRQHVELMGKYIATATRLLFMVEELQKLPTTKVLVDALQIELDEVRASLLLLFSFVYNREKMMKAKSAFQMKNRESIANALEVLEIEVPKEISLRFIRIFEPGNTADKCIALRAHFNEYLNYELIIDEILSDKHYYYHRWTKAAALHSAIFYDGREKRRWLEQAQRESDILLKETSVKILKEME